MKTSKDMTNLEIAKLLRAVSAAYEIKKQNRFKVIAYQNAASAIKHSSIEARDLWEDGKLTSLPSIGKNIASHLDELFKTGKVKHFNQVFKGLPTVMFTLMNLSGVGPKTAHKLASQLNLKSPSKALSQLKSLGSKGKISRLTGFGQESEHDILKAVSDAAKLKKDRMLLPYALVLSNQLIDFIKQSPQVIDCKPLGSLRRKAATIGDIDLAVATKKPEAIITHFLKFPQIKQITDKGVKKVSVLLKNRQQIDVRFHHPQEFGSLLQHFTGSKKHNIRLRQIALKKGLSLSEYGLSKNKKIKQFTTESDLYQALNMAWIPPELREDQGEIQAAQINRLPHLVNLKDIKGDLHVHTNFDINTSHDLGSDSVETLVKKAQKLNYQYIGFADHNPKSNLSSKKIISLVKRRKDKIDRINYSSEKRVKTRALNLLEIDIRPDGSLAVPEIALNHLDFAIVSIHSSFSQDTKTITKRVLSGLSHPKVKIFAHPASRLINHRQSINLDWDQIFNFCSKSNKILEINANPQRLDLPDTLVKQAIEKGVKLAINTDSHASDQLQLMPYGVYVARRGWAEPKDIINTLPFNKLKAILNLK